MIMDYIKGRGAQHNTHNKFIQHQHEVLDDFFDALDAEKGGLPS